jgi:microcin C transport system substrate-binding protein
MNVKYGANRVLWFSSWPTGGGTCPAWKSLGAFFDGGRELLNRLASFKGRRHSKFLSAAKDAFGNCDSRLCERHEGRISEARKRMRFSTTMNGAMRRNLLLPLLAALLLAAPAAAQTKVGTYHALTLADAPKYGPDFKALDYVNREAPKGGDLRLFDVGGFDTFNPYVIKGEPAPGIGLLFESLAGAPLDDPMTEYGLLAESFEVPEDLSWVAFTLRPEARWHDGKPVTADDVVWSFETLKQKGAPHYRFYYANVARAEKLGPREVKFHFTGPRNRELPQIVGQLPVLPKHYWAGREFEATTLEPPLGSGPYRIKEFAANRHVVYELVPDYWGRNLPLNRGRYNFATVRYDSYRDSTIALEAFKAGRYDIRTETSAKNWATAYDFPARQKGLVVAAEIRHQRPAGMQSFVFNTRRARFADRRVREALGLAFDFEWANKHLFYDQYVRTRSFFANSELAATGLPAPEELKLLEPLKDRLPPEVFTREYAPPVTDGSGSNRENLRAATRLLAEAGWTVRDNRLVGPQGEPMEIEFLLAQPEFERIIAPYVRSLERLGVKARIRTVDTAQYINRVRDFDFDMVVGSWGQSESPGNEQRDFWTSEAADRPGSRNLAGIKNPAIDRLVDALIGAPDRKSLIVATRALDRALLWSHYVVPNWHVNYDRIAYWDKFGRTGNVPRYGEDQWAWWLDPAKAAALQQATGERH